MDTHDQYPLVTLGMPVFNEATYLAESIDCLLKQTYPRLEIIIADNCSTDATSAICTEYASRHPQITYIRHPKNIGAHQNFSYLSHCASGTYFCWASGHDLLDEDFVEKSITVLERDTNIVLAYPRTINMMADGTHTREKVRHFDIRTMSASRRFREVMWRVDCNYVCGIWRHAPMLESNLFQRIPFLDRVFLAEMAIQGVFAPVDTFKYYRMNRPIGEKEETEMEKRRRIMRYLRPSRIYTDAQLMAGDYSLATRRALLRVVQDAGFPWYIRWTLFFSIWLCSVMKFHLFPGADSLSVLVKKLLPRKLLAWILQRMQ